MRKMLLLFCLFTASSVCGLLAQPVQEPLEIQRVMKKQAILEARLNRQNNRWDRRQVKQGNVVIDYFAYDKAEFLGGEGRLNCMLSSFIHYPDSARSMGICGTVIVHFCVEKDGTVKVAEATQKVHPMLDAEAVHGVKCTSGLWRPDRILDTKRRHWFNVPVRFQCSNDSDTIISKNNCDFTLFECHYPFRSALQNGDTIIVPLHYDKEAKTIAESDSLAFIHILKQLKPDEDVIVHLWTYRNYYYPENYLNGIVHQYAPRAALVVTHYADFGEVKGSYKYEKRYLKVLEKYPYITYAVIVKV